MTKIIAISAAMLVLTSVGASAGTLVNQDAEAYKISIAADNGGREFTIEANAKLDGICASTCKVTLGEDEGEEAEEIEITANDTVIISDGELSIADPANAAGERAQ